MAVIQSVVLQIEVISIREMPFFQSGVSYISVTPCPRYYGFTTSHTARSEDNRLGNIIGNIHLNTSLETKHLLLSRV